MIPYHDSPRTSARHATSGEARGVPSVVVKGCALLSFLMRSGFLVRMERPTTFLPPAVFAMLVSTHMAAITTRLLSLVGALSTPSQRPCQ